MINKKKDKYSIRLLTQSVANEYLMKQLKKVIAEFNELNKILRKKLKEIHS